MPGREVGVAHARLGLVLVLPAGAAAPEDVALQLVVAELDVDRVVDLGQHVDRGERRLPPVGGVERADPDQAVDPRLALEVAVGVLALDVDRHRLDAGDVPLLAVDDLGLVPLRLGPHQVHAQEHLGPVARLGAAGAGLDRDVGVAVVVGARRASSAARTPRSRPGPSPTPDGSRRPRRRRSASSASSSETSRSSACLPRASNGLRTALSVLSSWMTSLAFSWSFQKVPPFISCSSSWRRASLSPRSKRVS